MMVTDTTEARMRRAMTERAFLHPEPGDAFEEMMAFWVIVVAVGDGGDILVAEFSPPGELPADAQKVRRFPTVEEFRAAYAYGNIPGYSVSWARTADVDGWAELYLEQGRIEP